MYFSEKELKNNLTNPEFWLIRPDQWIKEIRKIKLVRASDSDSEKGQQQPSDDEWHAISCLKLLAIYNWKL